MLAAGEECRVLIRHPWRQADLVQVAPGAIFGFVLAHPQHPPRRHGNVVQHAQVAPQVEVLEHHGQACAQALQFVRVGDMQAMMVLGHVHRLAVEGHAAFVGLLEEVDATQEGTLARAAGADQADHVAGLRFERNALEHMVLAVAFVQVFDGQFVHAQALKVRFKATTGSRCGRPGYRPRER
ncbi:hypothetical protein D3C79_729130 [compost metagenome]